MAAPLRIAGVAVPFGRATTLRRGEGWIVAERVQRGAFTIGADVALDVGHAAHEVVASRASGTLDVDLDGERGVEFRAQLPDTPRGREIHALVAAGVLDSASVEWTTDTERVEITRAGANILRTLVAGELVGIALAPRARAAYPAPLSEVHAEGTA